MPACLDQSYVSQADSLCWGLFVQSVAKKIPFLLKEHNIIEQRIQLCLSQLPQKYDQNIYSLALRFMSRSLHESGEMLRRVFSFTSLGKKEENTKKKVGGAWNNMKHTLKTLRSSCSWCWTQIINNEQSISATSETRRGRKSRWM